ncbi:DUF4238 domain-containing protein [Cryobacterium sp. 5B3]|uniref:DUF4238 domain-containing protein n=1 Tax=Cryobacterium sp. 5B3 TaxID=3048586 RepID=UPI002AB4BFC7|nr:DUF4238 domain-containing protein [Cryobacterium sp. 5B3]MDY7541833.1 DUF4238 domain-containing protein [Cryobacterium sp. 5B3]MEB0274237.1 DUF4238 domain-containing protein [Cryobacterium sp. 5B3]
MADQPKRHHVVPQFYLRGFALTERLTAVQLSDGRRFPTVVRKAASETHFYRLAPDHRSGPLALENAFSRLEDDAAAILKRIIDGLWPLNFHGRRQLSFFIAVQLLRGPRFRGALEASGAIGTNGNGSAMTAIDMHAHQIATLAEEWMPQLVDRPWSLVRFTNRSLITSDSPVSSTPPLNYDAGRWAGAPFADAKEVLYPINRKIGLMMRDRNQISGFDRQRRTQEGVFDQIRSGTVRLEQHFNRSTAETATRCLYHHPSDAKFVPPEVPEPPSVGS